MQSLLWFFHYKHQNINKLHIIQWKTESNNENTSQVMFFGSKIIEI